MKKLFAALIAVFCLNLLIGANVSAAGLPRIDITLRNVSLQTVHDGPKTTKYDDNIVRITSDGMPSTFAHVQLKGRGNTTWSMPKRPYQLKFEEKIDLFGLGAEKTWVLLANYIDDSQMRNHLAFKISDMLEMTYSNRGTFADLYINGQYQGIYYVCHKTEISKHSANLKNPDGILVELENFGRETEDQTFKTNINQYVFKLSDSVSDEESEAGKLAYRLFQDAFNQFEQDLANRNWSAIVQDIDVDSFAKYLIMYEVSANPDGLVSSCYFYKDGANDVIHAGPFWDYDYAFGNYRWVGGWYPAVFLHNISWANLHMREQNETRQEVEIFMKLLNFREFRERVETIYREYIYQRANEIDAFLSQTTIQIRLSANYNNTYWHRDNFDLSTNALRLWVRQRLAYLDLLYGSTYIPEGSQRIATNSAAVNESILPQNYIFQPQTDGSVRILSTTTGLSLTADNTMRDADADVWFSKTRNHDSQHWYIATTNNRQSIIFSKTTGLVLTVSDDYLHLTRYTGDEEQLFSIILNLSATLHINAKSTYRIHPKNHPEYSLVFQPNQITVAANNNITMPSYRMIQVANGTFAVSTKVNNYDSRRWIIQGNSDGTYIILDAHTMSALSYDQRHGTFLNDTIDGDSQYWIIERQNLPQFSYISPLNSSLFY